MARTLARYIMAAVLIAAHVPLPAAPAKGGRHDGPMACCAPKACCAAGQACSMGGGCGGEATGSGTGPRMFAGGCGDEAPRVTPLQLDPTVAAQSASLLPAPATLRRLPDLDTSCSSLASRPLVPPPRA